MDEIDIVIPEYLDSKTTLVKIDTADGNMHYSWLLPNNKVIAFEQIPRNYPSSTLAVWKSLEEYKTAILEVDWIKNNLPADHIILGGISHEK